MSSKHFKPDVFTHLARIGKARGPANRLEPLEFVAPRPRSVDELAGRCYRSATNVSKHLQALRHAGFVTARKEGLRVFYGIGGSAVVALLRDEGFSARRLADAYPEWATAGPPSEDRLESGRSK